MRTALVSSRRRGVQTSRMRTVPSPRNGWNARDALSDMKDKDAVELTNWVVVPNGIRVRPGLMAWSTGLNGPIETLMEYAPPSGLGKLFAATPTDIYDVSVAGAVGVSVQTGLANGRWQSLNFSTTGGNYLFAVNGQDAARYYSAGAWTSPVITGVSTNTLVGIASHGRRLWFVQAGTRSAWYLDVQAIAGTATEFPLGPLLDKGGELIAIQSWRRDGGESGDNCLVFVSSKGQVAVYAGNDPASAVSFQLQGIYDIAEPIGRRCLYRLGAELLVLTSQGPIPLSQTAGLSVASQTNKSITDRISGAFRQAYEDGGGMFGWQFVEQPRTNLLLVNVPRRERANQDQFVFGTSTGAWSRFTGVNAGCFSLFGTELFAGGNDGAVRRLSAFTDEGRPIVATYRHAFLDLGTPNQKVFDLARPRMVAPPGYQPAVTIRTDYDASPLEAGIISAPPTGTAWDEGFWDQSSWGDEVVASQDWQGVNGIGSTASVSFQVAAQAPVLLNGLDLMFTAGGPL